MKTSTIIRFVLAAIFATLACVGLLMHMIGSAVLFSVPWLLLVRRAELTQPIPRNEWWLTFLVIGIFLAVMLTLPLLHLPATQDAVTHGMSHPMVATVLWI